MGIGNNQFKVNQSIPSNLFKMTRLLILDSILQDVTVENQNRKLPNATKLILLDSLLQAGLCKYALIENYECSGKEDSELVKRLTIFSG